MNIDTTPLRRPGRPKSAAKRDAICDAGAHLFLSIGWARTSMDAIAAAAGVSKQTVYSHFRSKDDLFRACVSSKMELYQLDSTATSAANLGEALTGFARHYLELLSDPQVIAMFRLLISQCTEFPHLISNFHEAGPETTEKAIERMLQNYAGDVFADNAMDGARQFLAMIRCDFFIDLLMGVRAELPQATIDSHVDTTVGDFLKIHGIA